MLDYLYYLFIAPLELIMQTVLEAGYTSFGTYGVALIFMSIVVNVMLLPLYHLAETWQESERCVQRSMERQLNRIKTTFTGRERYMLMSTLYRQHEYHPIYAVRTSFGFLIQVPFFFAAYHFLSNYAPLHGASFWIFSNLALPDALIRLGGFDVNVLPILMTVINIFSALVYTNRLSRRDKVQLYVMAGLFLVLLYTAPSGLVFYWTCNNIFSLLKNMVYEELGIFSHGSGVIKKTKARLVLDHFGDAFEHLATGKVQVCFLAAGVLFSLCQIVLIHQDAAAGTALTLCKAGAGICLGWFALIFFAWVMTGRFSLLLWAVFCAACLFAGASSSLALFFTAALILLCYQDFAFANKTEEAALALSKKEVGAVSTKSLLLIALTVFFVSPAGLLAADKTFLTSCTLAVLTLACGLFVIVPYSIFRLARRNLGCILAVLYCTCALLVLLYTQFLTRDYGPLDAFMFAWTMDMFHAWYIPLDIAVALVLLLAVTALFKKRRLYLVRLLNVCLLMTVILGGMAWFKVATAEDKTAEPAARPGDEQPIHLSKTQPNVLVLMLDMFTGDHVAYMKAEKPELLAGFDGFTWYPDTISEADVTIMSLPSIIAGDHVAPHNVKDDGKSLDKKVQDEAGAFLESLQKKGFSTKIAVSDDIDFLADEPYVSRKLYRRFVPDATPVANQKNSDVYGAVFAASYGLLEGLPWSLRQYVYRDGNWLIPESMVSINHVVGVTHSKRHFAVLEGLSSLTKIDDGQGSYTVLTNELSHIPWFISGETLKPIEEDPYPETSFILDMRNGRIPEHYYAEEAAMQLLSRFFAKLKEEGVYDNTLIFVVSDHCEGDSQPLAKVFGKPNPTIAQGGTYPGRPGSLFMVKPFGAKGALKTDDTPMKSSDVRPYIEAVLAKQEFAPGKDRERFHATGEAIRRLHKDNAYDLQSLWKITGPRYDRTHWEMLFNHRGQTF